jgi:hypothetical protein
MLNDIKPNLENITDQHTVFPDNFTKNALAQFLQNLRVQAFQTKIWFHTVHKPDAERLGRFEQPEAQTRPRQRKLIGKIGEDIDWSDW